MPSTEREAVQVLMLRHLAAKRCERLIDLAARPATPASRYTPRDQRKLLERLSR